MGLVLLTAPAAEPVTLTEAKAHCRVETSADDALLTALIVSARRLAETLTSRALIEQQWRVTRDGFPCGLLQIPLPPLVSVQSVKYIDTNGTLQTLSPSLYAVYTSGVVGLVAPVYGESWPDTRCEPESVRVEFTAGFSAAAADVPQEIKQWMLLCVGSWYAQRESIAAGNVAPVEIPRGLWDALLDGYRVVTFA